MKKVFVLLCIIFFIVSCTKEETIIENLSKDSRFSTENGIVYFKNQSAFDSVMNDLNHLKTSQLPQWEAEKDIRNSLRKKQREFKDTAEIQTEPLVQDLRFASIVNDNGVFAIGDSIHLITKKTVYIFHKKNKNLIEKTIDLKKISTIGARKFNIITVQLKNKNSKLKFTGTHGINVYYNSIDTELPSSSAVGARYVEVYCWCKNFGAYSSIGIGLHSYLRTKNIWGTKYWKDSPCDYIWLGGSTSFTYYGETSGAYDEDSDTNEYNEQCSLAWAEPLAYMDAIRVVAEFRWKLNSNYPEWSYSTWWGN